MINKNVSHDSFEFTMPPFNNSKLQFSFPNSLIKQFKDNILFPLQTSEGENPYCLKRPLGVLLFGAPGQGKSTLAKVYAQMLEKPYVVINRYHLMQKGCQEISCEFLRLIESATENSGTIIIENIESIIPRREMIKNELLRLDVANILDIISHCIERKIIIIGTTSNPQEIDAQIGFSGFLNELIYVPFPDSNMRRKIISSSLECRPVDDIDIEQVVMASDGFSTSGVLQIIEDAALQCALSMTSITTNVIIDYIKSKNISEQLRVRDKYDKLSKQLIQKELNQKLSIGFI